MVIDGLRNSSTGVPITTTSWVVRAIIASPAPNASRPVGRISRRSSSAPRSMNGMWPVAICSSSRDPCRRCLRAGRSGQRQGSAAGRHGRRRRARRHQDREATWSCPRLYQSGASYHHQVPPALVEPLGWLTLCRQSTVPRRARDWYFSRGLARETQGPAPPLTIRSRPTSDSRGYSPAVFAELTITMSDATVWLSIGQALLFGGVCLLFGIWVARLVGLLPSDAPAGETLGVGLASGLMVLAAWWAALASGGRSSFTPVAVGFAIAVTLALVRRARPDVDPVPISAAPSEIAADTPESRSTRLRNLAVAVLAGAVFIVALALIFGSTLTLRPRDGIQPIEFQDVAFYSVLGADLAETGTETIYTPSGFSRPEGLPAQTWYHWGEIWLASAAILIFGMAPIDARHFVVLPLLLLAAATLTGTLVRRMTGACVAGRLPLRVARLPLPGADAAVPGPVLQSVARRPRLHDHRVRPGRGGRSTRAVRSRGTERSAADLDPGHLRRQRYRADPARPHRDRRAGSCRYRDRLDDPGRAITRRSHVNSPWWHLSGDEPSSSPASPS